MAQFSSKSLLSNAADHLPTLPKTQSKYAARNRYAVLGFIYYGFSKKLLFYLSPAISIFTKHIISMLVNFLGHLVLVLI